MSCNHKTYLDRFKCVSQILKVYKKYIFCGAHGCNVSALLLGGFRAKNDMKYCYHIKYCLMVFHLESHLIGHVKQKCPFSVFFCVCHMHCLVRTELFFLVTLFLENCSQTLCIPHTPALLL